MVTVIMVYALANFTLAQMRTLGTAFAGISQGRIPMWVGVIALAIVMLVYESLGGMRSVAWTDAIQGGILLVGFLILTGLAFSQFPMNFIKTYLKLNMMEKTTFGKIIKNYLI